MILLRDIGMALVVASFAIALGLATGSVQLATVVFALTTLAAGVCLGELTATTVGVLCGLALLLDGATASPVAAVTLSCGLAAVGRSTARAFAGVERTRAKLEWQTDIAAALTAQLRVHLGLDARRLTTSPTTSGSSSASIAEPGVEDPLAPEPLESAAAAPIPHRGQEAADPTEGVAELLGAVASISASLTEPRIVDATLLAVANTVAAARATFHPHDRKTDRALPGKSILRGAGAIDADVVDPKAYEDLLRLAARKREALVRGSATEGVAGAFAQISAIASECPDVVLPVFDRAMLAGFLVVYAPCGDAPIESLQILTSACGLALSGARLSARCESQQRVDSLTGVLTSDAVREVVERHAALGPAAVLLLAADHLRKVNELYGRRTGDRTLVEFTRLVVREVGNDGVVGRYGGASLLIVLPGSRSDAAIALAERLLRRVRKTVVAGPEGLAQSLTACAGIASVSGGTPDLLLQGAERALNVAQRSGVNRIYVDGAEAPENARA